MIDRTIAKILQRYAKEYPVVTLTGPRQSGKTTICKALFPKKKYFSMENLDVRDYAKNDPRGFLNECLPEGAILDEIQRTPELLSYIQEIVDEQDRTGLFILTGSQNFQLLDSVNQSLAGRTALTVLLPFSYEELYKEKIIGIDDVLFSGFYPRIYDKNLQPTEALSFYVGTYLERDIRSLINIKDLSKFESFLKLCAGRTGQIVNFSSLANDCGVTHNTAKSWLSVLEASYILFFARPHHANFGKRLIKSPKLYFTDCGLAAYLLDIQDPSHIKNHPLKGALFETFAMGELLKTRFNQGKNNNIYFFRDNVGNEVDAILEQGNTVHPVEIKLGSTINTDTLKGLKYYQNINKNIKKPTLIFGGTADQNRSNVHIVSYRKIEEVNI